MLFTQKAVQVVEDEMTEEERHEAIVNAALEGVTIRVEYVTPEKAKHILLGNVRNRNLKHRNINAMARDLSKGEFLFNGDAIRTDKKGVLLDGQNRLHAIIKSECGAPLLIVEGLPTETQDVMDQGEKRSPADMLKLRGETHCTVLAATLRSIFSLKNEGFGAAAHSGKVTNAEISETLDDNPHVRDSIATCYARYAAAMRFTTPSLTCFLYFIFSLKNQERADEFFEGFSTGVGLGRKDPRLTLRTKLTALNAGKSRPRANVIIYMVLRAWNAFSKKQTLERISVPNGKITKWPEV